MKRITVGGDEERRSIQTFTSYLYSGSNNPRDIDQRLNIAARVAFFKTRRGALSRN